MNPVDLGAGAAIAMLLVSLLILVFNTITAPRLGANDSPRRFPRVSVLVPARDEEGNLPRTLEAWSRVDYPDWELLVLDDLSTDGTSAILRAALQWVPHLRIITGTEPPPGWSGKNWACHQLQQQASGEILLFADADVSPAPKAVRASVALLEREDAHALSAFGTQETTHWASRAVVPLVMEVGLCSLLPFRLAQRSRTTVFLAAVGQWFLFRREVYRRIGGHEAVKDQVAEDLALGARLKQAGLRLVPALGMDLLSVRMYRDLPELWRGFSKNLSRSAGSGTPGFALAQFPLALCHLLPWILALSGRPLALVALVLSLALRLAAARLWRRPLADILLQPVGTTLVLAIGIRSALTPFWPVAWKGRTPCRIPATQS